MLIWGMDFCIGLQIMYDKTKSQQKGYNEDKRNRYNEDKRNRNNEDKRNRKLLKILAKEKE